MDLNKCKNSTDLKFVQNIVIPLLMTEENVPVCFWPFNPETGNYYSSYKPEQSAIEDIQSIPQEKRLGFLKQSLLEGRNLSTFIRNFRNIVDQKGKSQAQTLMNKKWECALKHDLNTQRMDFKQVWSTLAKKGPFIILIRSEKQQTNEECIYGMFCTLGLPSFPSNIKNYGTYLVPANPEDFFFCYEGEQHIHHFAPAFGESLMSIHPYTSGFGAIYTAGSFISLTMSSHNKNDTRGQICCGGSYKLKKIEKSKNPKTKKQMPYIYQKVTQIEFWIQEQSQLKSSQNEITDLDMNKFYHPWHQQDAALQYFRANPVFTVPSHLTFSQLSKIMLERTVKLTTLSMRIDISENHTVGQLYNEFLKKTDGHDHDQILDLKYSSIEYFQNNKEEEKQIVEEFKEHENKPQELKFSQKYQPEYKLLNQLMSIGGMKTIVLVAIETLKQSATSKFNTESLTWLSQIKDFEEFPECFDKLFSLDGSKTLISRLISDEYSKLDEKDQKEERQELIQQLSIAKKFTFDTISKLYHTTEQNQLKALAYQKVFIMSLFKLGELTGEKARYVGVEVDEVEELKEEVKMDSAGDQYKKQRKGVGYFTDQVAQPAYFPIGGSFVNNSYGSLNPTSFDFDNYQPPKQEQQIPVNEDTKQNEFLEIKEVIITLSSFLEGERIEESTLEYILESPLLPFLEQVLRNGSILEIVKQRELYFVYLNLVRVIASHDKLLPCLVELDKKYVPNQVDPIYCLLEKLNELATIFLACLENQNQSVEETKSSIEVAEDIKSTHRLVQKAISYLKKDIEESHIEDVSSLPIAKSYPLLLKDLRFDYMDMSIPSSPNYSHHYNAEVQKNLSPPPQKMLRLAQELADLSHALPYEHTNAIFLRVDRKRFDTLKALICGAENTPYAHGCFEFDIYCEDKYPSGPPKINLMTTGAGTLRFNPNLYSCGKVCLSLLGTWRGNASENWDPKLSTILQVLLSTQSIIMSEEVYFNEPGREQQAGTPQGELQNEGYSNIVKYGNIKHAMIDQILNPSKGFESVIKRHFYLKKSLILKEVNGWLEVSQRTSATYLDLVQYHNSTLATQFASSPTKYSEMLSEVIKELEHQLNLLESPSQLLISSPSIKSKEQEHQVKEKKQNQGINEGKADLNMVDVETDEEEETQINTHSKKEINVDDEAVKDRWSRYIGVMGVEAVAKQAKANVFISGAGALGIEIAKNIVLSGCRSLTLHDYKRISYQDLSGQFLLNLEEDVLNEKKKLMSRGEVSLPRLQQLNYYVKCKLAPPEPMPNNLTELCSDPWNLQQYDVIILTEASYEQCSMINAMCNQSGKKLICADAYGPFGRIFNYFGSEFEVLDQNGEELQEVMIKSISNEEEGLVELLPSSKHRFGDDDEIVLTEVKGMELQDGFTHEIPSLSSPSINGTIHKIKVINPFTFRIGDTRRYGPYELNGIAKQLKLKRLMRFEEFKEVIGKGLKSMKQDENLGIADFEKIQNNVLSHICFEALDQFKSQEGRMPGVWNVEDGHKFVSFCKIISKDYELSIDESEQDLSEIKFFYSFSFTCQGVLNPLCAFIGGFVAQECIKAITNKFAPINQLFYFDTLELIPHFTPSTDLKNLSLIFKQSDTNSRYEGLRTIVGDCLLSELAYTRLFMVGSGAIGCELLKNYAMIGLGTGKKSSDCEREGQIVLTDPDVIEVSNLNRQFLFREKHLRKPKSQVAAAAAVYMNRDLKENIVARLDKVHEGTSHIFSNEFFEQLSVVTNALDNVQARRYIDQRCVSAKIPLIESGTLGPKGHVQVVIPYLTESYGSMEDPENNHEIPHCTLKMFPEEILHCVEWARDKFGKIFTQAPKNAIRILEEMNNQGFNYQQEVKVIKECIKLLQKRPKNFDQCIEQARVKFQKFFNSDIKQLIAVYPLDSKTKEGNPFWTLPKRPPVPINFDKSNTLHCRFISSLACLKARVFKIPIPSPTPRSEEFIKQIGHIADKIELPEFIVNDQKAKQIAAQVDKQDANKSEEVKEETHDDQNLTSESGKELFEVVKQMKKMIDSQNPQPEKPYRDYLIQEEEFEKDNDQNFHIDFIFAMANCRALNYKLDSMDWLTVKIKAGRIVPALATTTACIAGLQTLELMKLIKKVKKGEQRNMFLNLAVPMMQASEPADVQKVKLTDQLEVTLWDRWEIEVEGNVSLEGVMKGIEKKYRGIKVRDVIMGNTPIYLHAMLGGEGKANERETILNSELKKLAFFEHDEQYLDLNITCYKAEGSDDSIIPGIPIVRVFFH